METKKRKQKEQNYKEASGESTTEERRSDIENVALSPQQKSPKSSSVFDYDAVPDF